MGLRQAWLSGDGDSLPSPSRQLSPRSLLIWQGLPVLLGNSEAPESGEKGAGGQERRLAAAAGGLFSSLASQEDQELPLAASCAASWWLGDNRVSVGQ